MNGIASFPYRIEPFGSIIRYVNLNRRFLSITFLFNFLILIILKFSGSGESLGNSKPSVRQGTTSGRLLRGAVSKAISVVLVVGTRQTYRLTAVVEKNSLT